MANRTLLLELLVKCITIWSRWMAPPDGAAIMRPSVAVFVLKHLVNHSAWVIVLARDAKDTDSRMKCRVRGLWHSLWFIATCADACHADSVRRGAEVDSSVV